MPQIRAATERQQMNTFETPEAWRKAAMLRKNGVDAPESERRRAMVNAHHAQEGTVPDVEQMADYELYIHGKMEVDEYQQYLLFKHSVPR